MEFNKKNFTIDEGIILKGIFIDKIEKKSVHNNILLYICFHCYEMKNFLILFARTEYGS